MKESIKKITSDDLTRATEILTKYKSQKASLEKKIIKDEEFWRLHQWAYMTGGDEQKSSSPWLFSCIISKLADIMDGYPQANFIARQENDKEEAKILSKIVPMILRLSDHEMEYMNGSLYTIKHGGGCYGIFWDGQKHGGLGDVVVKRVDLLNLYWKGGITDIQSSPHVFYTETVDNEILLQMYPKLDKQKLTTDSKFKSQYITDESVDTTDSSVVVDWYYHTVDKNGRRLLQLCKFVGREILFSSENEADKYPNGWYEHGKYPFEIQPLFPTESSLCGYGYMDIGAGTQEDIDRLGNSLMKNAAARARPRFFFNNSAGINETEFCDWTKDIVHSNGGLGEDAVRQIRMDELSGSVMNYREGLINQLKETTANRDVNNGSTGSSGITAASAIAALQESAGKVSRLNNRTFYACFERVIRQVVELIRQFYTTPRVFRIISDNGREEYLPYQNNNLKAQPLNDENGEQTGFRQPDFDIEITAQKATAYTKLSHNELIIQLYNLGAFNPNNADQALMLIKNMDFEHKDEIINGIMENKNLLSLMQYFQKAAFLLAQRYEPRLIGQLQSALQGESVPSFRISDEDVKTKGHEHPQVERAREQTQNSTQV